jgi:hypothetical protein
MECRSGEDHCVCTKTCYQQRPLSEVIITIHEAVLCGPSYARNQDSGHNAGEKQSSNDVDAR